jgi:creatinine amidohydrolase/Fe(II)-dependent formamide hydrolase-like protein
LKSDYNTHIASTTYHVAADLGTVTVADATTEPTLVALTNSLRTLMGTHAVALNSHGGLEDTVFTAAVAATTVATNAASAITLENALATAWLAHIAVTSAGIYEQVPANTALVWDSNTAMWLQLETSGNVSVRTDT